MCLAMTVIKGVQRDFPLAGDWGCPPAIHIPPLLEERGIGGEVNGDGSTSQVIASHDLLRCGNLSVSPPRDCFGITYLVMTVKSGRKYPPPLFQRSLMAEGSVGNIDKHNYL